MYQLRLFHKKKGLSFSTPNVSLDRPFSLDFILLIHDHSDFYAHHDPPARHHHLCTHGGS